MAKNKPTNALWTTTLPNLFVASKPTLIEKSKKILEREEKYVNFGFKHVRVVVSDFRCFKLIFPFRNGSNVLPSFLSSHQSCFVASCLWRCKLKSK